MEDGRFSRTEAVCVVLATIRSILVKRSKRLNRGLQSARTERRDVMLHFTLIFRIVLHIN
jgi:hypothetical protein